MQVLVFHAYLLHGTGSNIYNASLAQALARMGHEVHLFCQDREAASLPWVDDFVDLRNTAPPPHGSPGEVGTRSERGSITVYVPDIGGLLPVFVLDRYEGFDVKTFPQLTDAELAGYIDANVSAVARIVDSLGSVDAAVASHLVMGPVVLSRAGLRYSLKVHGSDLSYTVLPHLERFRPYALEAAANATAILVSTEHVAARFRLAVDDPGLEEKLRLAPPGVDTDLFAPVPEDEAAESLQALASELRGRRPAPGDAGPRVHAASVSGRGPAPPSSWDRDTAEAARAIDWFADAMGPRVVYVGKLIVSKGPDLLLAAWPLIYHENPDARLLMVGFGAYEVAARRLWSALESADLEAVREFAARGRALEEGPEGPLRMLGSFVGHLPEGYVDAARAAAGSVAFAGRLEHGEVGRLVPATDVLVVPSTFPESFGMVATEAAAAETLPVSAAHSGLLEVSRELSAALPREAADLVSFPLDDGAVKAIADRLNRWLALDPAVRERARDALRETAARLWSWEGVAGGVLAASAGRLDELPSVPGPER